MPSPHTLPSSITTTTSANRRATNASGSGRRTRPPHDPSRQVRKRTKTGCMTCRQRRIKCGEERDQCENCRKSKRPCSYPQDVQLKNGNHVVLPQPNGSRHYPACSPPANPLVGISGHHLEPGFSGPRRASADGDHLPRPFGSIDYQSPTGGYDLGNHGLRPSPHALGESIDPAAFAGDSGTGWGQGSDSSRQPSFTAYDSTTPAYCHDEARPPRLLVYEEPFIGVPQEHESQLYTEKGDLPYPGSVLKEEQSHYYHDYRAPSSYEDAATQTGSGAREDKLMHWPGMSRDAWDRGASTVIRNDMPAFGGFAYAQAFATSGAGLTTDFLNNAAIAIHDDDYWDVTSEDDEEIARRQSQMLQDGHVEQDLTRILTLTQQSMRLAVAAVQDPLSYTYPGFSMTHYIPEFAANPLNNIYTQRVFAHFVFSTAPLISFLQQRNRPSFLGEAPHGSATYSCQGLWNYVLAMMALYDQGLLHAMLAMGSYHIAKLQGASTTPAQKHYGYAIRYIHKSVRPEKKRHAATTLAATLLLAFYEVMTADHRAWNTHLAGAIQLVREIDFTSMTNHIRRAKQRTSARRRSGSSSTHDDLVDAIFPDIDTKLVNQLKGKNEKPNENITSKGSEAAFDDSSVLTILELRQYSILQDLYWYACRHDMIHGMVGGTTLLLDYKKWGDCPPRGPVGRADYICGTFDHVVLLIGRLICFIDKDRPRKIKAGHAKSHSATPGPSFPTKGEPLGRHPPMLMPSGPMPGPGFWGMAPSDGPSHMPRAFEPTQPLDSSMPQTPAEDDLEAAARRATAEWQTIIDAFDKMEEMMLSAFAPLPIGPTQPLLPTPFGPAIVYPSSTIAAVWTWFLCGRIVALRSHPSTPAATIYAVGAAMQNTHELAMRVGRISYPLTSNFNGVPPEVNHAGAFAECCLPMFFAGVQFLTKPQREWTLRRLQEIETLTGWSTIALIANGCESNWVALGAKGISETWTKRYGVEEGEDKTLVEEISEEEEPLITPNGDPTARSVDPALQEAQMRKAERQKGFATFKKKDGEKMYAYKVYNSDEKERLLG